MIYNVPAKYKIEENFNITGRGLVLVGEILEGVINRGNRICFELDTIYYELKILGVEDGRRLDSLGNPIIIYRTCC